MNSFPEIQRQAVIQCFDSIVNLYEGDQVRLLETAEKVLMDDPVPFRRNLNDINNQIAFIRHKIQRIANNYGRNILVKWIEELYESLNVNGGAIGVSIDKFLTLCKITIEDGIFIKLLPSGKWIIEWSVPSQEEQEFIWLSIRDKLISSSENIVPNYIIQFVTQGIIAYRKKNYLTSLSLISIALEGTLRDVLEIKGFTYAQGSPSEDTYDFAEMNVSQNTNGFNVNFSNQMPKIHSDFLTEVNSPNVCKVRLKRIKRKEKWYLEIRDADYLKDYWSSDVITQQGQKNIGGLGTALAVARNEAAILDSSILPDDMDEVIQQVRNNLIHLSGNAITTRINSVDMSLNEFASNQARVFDAIWSITGAIDKLYIKKSNGSL